LSAMAAGMEVYTAVVALRGGEAAAKTAARTRLIAKLAGGASLIEGVWLIFKGGARVQGGDGDSGWWTVYSGAFLIAGGVTTIVGGGLVAGAIAAGTSALTVPIVGWAVATVILLGLSIYCLVNAASTDDSNLLPLEYWLDNGSFGNGAHRGRMENPFYDKAAKAAAKPFPSLTDEVREFQRIVFAAVGEMGGMSDRGGNSLVSNYSVSMPRWVSTSTALIELHGQVEEGPLKKVAEFRFAAGRKRPERLWYAPRVFGMKQDPQLEVDSEIGSARISGYVSVLKPGGVAEGVENFFEWLGVADSKNGRVYFEKLRMTLTYEPDAEGMPGIRQTLTDWS